MSRADLFRTGIRDIATTLPGRPTRPLVHMLATSRLFTVATFPYFDSARYYGPKDSLLVHPLFESVLALSRAVVTSLVANVVLCYPSYIFHFGDRTDNAGECSLCIQSAEEALI